MIDRIYRIIHTESEICYIGSTFNQLRHRWQNHKQDYQKWLNKKTPCHSTMHPKFKEFGINQFKIILIKEYEVVDRTHLEGYEQLWINKFRKTCINKYNPFSIKSLSDQQYREANKDKINEKAKKYREANKEALNEKGKQYSAANKDKVKAKDKTYREANIGTIKTYQKQYREANKEKVNQKHSCSCGGRYTHGKKACHLKTKKTSKLVKDSTLTF